MSWPKKHTRCVHVNDREFLWHLSGNNIESDTRITVGTQNGKSFLFIDPYDHDFEIKPSNIQRAIGWALEQGWLPDKGPSRAMAFSSAEKTFFWLPENSKFAYQMEKKDEFA